MDNAIFFVEINAPLKYYCNVYATATLMGVTLENIAAQIIISVN